MQKNRLYLLVSLLALCFLIGQSQCFSEKITVTTFYPSPYGSFRELRAIKLGLGDDYSDVSQYCWNGACGTMIDSDADLVVQGKVGIGTVEPQANLSVIGAATFGAGNNKATGVNSVAMGERTTATHDCAVAMGWKTVAGFKYATAMGGLTNASGEFSTALGVKTTASGSRSLATGADTLASGDFSTAMGGFSIASGNASFAIGTRTTASNIYSSAFGLYTISNGYSSTAMGNYIDVQGDYSFGIGLDASAVPYPAISQNNTMAIIGGNVGIGTVSPGYQLELSADSAKKPNGGTWAGDSDVRLKKDIQPITGALDKITQLQGVSFKWINPEEHGELTGAQGGFIAQDVEKIFPEWVDESIPKGKDIALLEEKDGKVKVLRLPFEYDAYIVEAVKELKEQNAALKLMVEALRIRINELNKRVEKIEGTRLF